MLALLTVLMLLMSLLLIGVVLLQPGKGDMLSGMGGLGGQFSNMLGSRRATDLLSKITIGLAAGILVLSVVTNKFFVGGGSDGPRPVTEGVVIPKTVPTSAEQTQIPVPVPQEAPAETENPEKK
ncbi:MAG: preprotein translocase subunit SecG [Candidatus Kapabacteria bacterium]|nr:preprotein translocase subunit SecG [Ignavibacteriota bacterium]MCW5884427.1 preprotein translocase subunit SecG [Candidatus Kapabacteria bacterium]